MRAYLIALGLLLGTAPAPALAQFGGAQRIYVDQAVNAPRCIMPGQLVSLTAIAARVNKRDGFFRSDERAILTFETQFAPPTSAPAEIAAVGNVTLTSTSEHPVADFSDGPGSLAIAHSILSGHATSGPKATFSTIHIRTIMVTEAKLGKGGKIIADILRFAGSGDMPKTPYAAGFQLVSKIYTSVAQPIINGVIGNRGAMVGDLLLRVTPSSADCNPAADGKVGTVAFLFRTERDPRNTPGYISDFSNLEARLCFMVAGSGNELVQAPRSAGGCPSDVAAYQGVANSYVVLMATASPDPNAPATAPPQPITVEQLALLPPISAAVAQAAAARAGFADATLRQNLIGLSDALRAWRQLGSVLTPADQSRMGNLATGPIAEVYRNAALCARYGLPVDRCVASPAAD